MKELLLGTCRERLFSTSSLIVVSRNLASILEATLYRFLIAKGLKKESLAVLLFILVLVILVLIEELSSPSY